MELLDMAYMAFLEKTGRDKDSIQEVYTSVEGYIDKYIADKQDNLNVLSLIEEYRGVASEETYKAGFRDAMVFMYREIGFLDRED